MADLTEAIKEAYAMAPAGVVILHTLELRHPAFVDDDENPIAIRAVRNYPDTKTWINLVGAPVQALLDGLDQETRELVGLVAYLEDNAPQNPGELVYFTAIAFDIELPKTTNAPVPEVVVSLDNVADEIDKHLSAAATSQQNIALTYRPYLSNEVSGPHWSPPPHFSMTVGEADQLRVTGRAAMKNMSQKGFPGEVYSIEDFPGLARG